MLFLAILNPKPNAGKRWGRKNSKFPREFDGPTRHALAPIIHRGPKIQKRTIEKQEIVWKRTQLGSHGLRFFYDGIPETANDDFLSSGEIVLMGPLISLGFGKFCWSLFLCFSLFCLFQMATVSLEFPMVGENFSFNLVPDRIGVVNEPRNR